MPRSNKHEKCKIHKKDTTHKDTTQTPTSWNIVSIRPTVMICRYDNTRYTFNLKSLEECVPLKITLSLFYNFVEMGTFEIVKFYWIKNLTNLGKPSFFAHMSRIQRPFASYRVHKPFGFYFTCNLSNFKSSMSLYS